LEHSPHTAPLVSRPAPIVLAAVYFFYGTVILRTLAEAHLIASALPAYLGLEFLFGMLFTLVLWRPIRRGIWPHLYFIFQTLLVLRLLLPYPRLDFFNILLALLSFQAPLLFVDWRRWTWVMALVSIIILSLTVLLGVYGFALSLIPAAASIIFPGYVAVAQEIETAQHKRQELLAELQQANQQLTASADQVEELSSIQERDRLARELHDSVSQTVFSISLHTRAAQIILERQPDRIQSQLERLQVLSRSALDEMRGLIAHLRPPENESAERIKT
jgi:signal transduction histidine kinase